ncbi:hypothetical protein [Streptomyces arboris]|uniref:hypothetical protein n=1 Tax=Streptomyces arboris TaxID=2600619 RepID=UPI00178C750A|nr:hypothetical protein [Streptomyces arboris]
MTSIASTLDAPRAGLADDMTEDDNGRGFERDETDALRQLVQQLVDHGDDRAAGAGRRARRTLQEMAPDYIRQPVLTLLPQTASDDACGLCHRWGCTGHDCPRVTALTDQEREDLSRKVGEANRRSETRPR